MGAGSEHCTFSFFSPRKGWAFVYQDPINMDCSNVLTAVKIYNWRGQHVSYHANGNWIPCDERNQHFRALRDRIADKQCEEIEPQIVSATKVYSSEGRVTGYDSNCGFIPHDTGNRLFQLLQDSIDVGTCRVEEPRVTEQARPKIEALIFCIVLDRGWQHVVGPLTRRFEYSAKPGVDPVSFPVFVQNLPDEAQDVFPYVCEALGAAAPEQSIGMRCLRAGMIAVEIPVASLLKLFRSEYTRLERRIDEFINDQLELNYVRSDRNKSRGPSIDWLIGMAPYYLSYAVIDTANVALQAFALEYGGAIPGHITEDGFLRSHRSFARCDDGSVSLYRSQHQPDHSFQLQGSWERGAVLATIADPERRKAVNLSFVASRVRQLFNAGFAAEALVVANAAFEVVVERFLIGAVAVHPAAPDRMDKKSHRRHLEFLKEIVSAGTEPILLTDEFREFLSTMFDANEMRNNYLHQLIPPSEDPWNLAELDRTVERVLPFLTDPFRFAITLGRLCQPGFVQPATMCLLLKQLELPHLAPQTPTT